MCHCLAIVRAERASAYDRQAVLQLRVAPTCGLSPRPAGWSRPSSLSARTASFPGRPAAWSAFARRPGGRFRAGHRLRHGRHQHRRLAFDGRYELEYETEKAGVRVVAPMMAIETVAAGGGSICRFDGVKLVVGPDSAGADPGPACYGRGGPLAVTDVNLLPGQNPARAFSVSARSGRGRAAIGGAWPTKIAAATGDSLRADRVGRRLPRKSPTPTWSRRSARSRSPRAATRETMCWCRSAARRGSTPAPWPASWESANCSAIRTPAAQRLRHRPGRRRAASGRRRLSPVFAETVGRAGAGVQAVGRARRGPSCSLRRFRRPSCRRSTHCRRPPSRSAIPGLRRIADDVTADVTGDYAEAYDGGASRSSTAMSIQDGRWRSSRPGSKRSAAGSEPLASSRTRAGSARSRRRRTQQPGSTVSSM